MRRMDPLAALALLAAILGANVQAQPPTPAAQATPTPAAQASPTPKAEDKPKVNVSGYMQVLFSTAFDTNDDGQKTLSNFQVRRARVQVKGEVIKDVGYTVLLDGASPSNLLRDGFISLSFIKNTEIRLGQQKTQFGYENPAGDPTLYVINRALVSDALARGPDIRDLGIGALGNWGLSGGFSVDYGLTLVNGSGPNTTKDETSRKNFWGRVGGRYEDKEAGLALRFGGSLASGDFLDKRNVNDPNDDVVTDFSRAGADVTADSKWFFAAAELVFGTNKAPSKDTDARGAYVLLVGKTKLGLGALLRWERHSPDRDDSTKDQGRITLGAYYDLRPVNVRLAVNYEIDNSETKRDNALFVQGQVLF
jgi:phosphate-selective porin O/P